MSGVDSVIGGFKSAWVAILAYAVTAATSEVIEVESVQGVSGLILPKDRQFEDAPSVYVAAIA